MIRVAVPDLGQVVDGGRDAGQSLMILGPGHPAVRRNIRNRPQLVRGQLFEQFTPAPQDTDVRPEEFVRRAGEKVAIEFPNINRKMQAMDLGSTVPLYIHGSVDLSYAVTKTLNDWVKNAAGGGVQPKDTSIQKTGGTK